MILEGIVTTPNADGTTNVSPMGPIVDASMHRLVLRPFETSTTFANLRRVGVGVFHVTDDVELLAAAAIGQPPSVTLEPCGAVACERLTDTCRWYAFRVETFDDAEPRATIEVSVVEQGRVRDFFGFNRAKHAVVEAAILATRVDLLEAQEIVDQYRQLAVIVEKTAGEAERRGFAMLAEYVQSRIGRDVASVG